MGSFSAPRYDKTIQAKEGTRDGNSTSVALIETIDPRWPSWFTRDWLWGLILILAVILTYSPVWWAGFIWDDDDHVTANPCILGPLGLKEIWTTSAARYYPLVLTTFWFEHALWGLAPLPYHLVNVLLHGMSAIVLWRLLRSLQVPGAWLGAALWALHPVQVQTVAWISEMKNTQSCLFYLLSIFFFVRWLKMKEVNGRSYTSWSYALTLFFAALAMTSKSSTVILPMVLCLCAWWVEGGWRWRSIKIVGPVLLMSVSASVLAMWSVEIYGDSDNPQWVQSWPERFVTAGKVVWFYLGKLAWPQPLIFIYPRWEIDAREWSSYVPLLAAIIILSILWCKRETWSRPYFGALAYFLAALLPVLGLIEHYYLRYSFVADHLQYLASIGPLALAGAGVARWSNFAFPKQSYPKLILYGGLLLILGMLSWRQAWLYQDDQTLWTDTLNKNPTCWIAGNNLGVILLQKGQVDETIVQYQKAIEINPHFAQAYNNLGGALVQKGQLDNAIVQFQKAIAINPHFAQVYNNLGAALVQKGQVDNAIVQFQKALEISPDYADAHDNLGLTFFRKGNMSEAMMQYQKALAINPNFAKANNNLGNIFLQMGKIDEAIVRYQKALAIDPNFDLAQNNLGNAFSKNGRLDEAIAQYQKALAINPGFFEAYSNLGLVLFRKGQVDEAIKQYKKALAIAPDYAKAHNNLGNALLQKGHIDEAIIQFQDAFRLRPDDSEAENNLARAQALQKREKGTGTLSGKILPR